ncbi:MAG: GNAT family N-acetyltransferase [Ferruginibacter sp.]
MEITIRRVTATDVPRLSVIAKQIFYDTFTGTCTEADMQGFLIDYFGEEPLGKEISNEKDYYYFAEVGGVAVGYIRFMEDYSSFPLVQQWKALELKRIYILKEYHSRGIAQKLMDFYMDYAISQEFKVLWLGVWEHNLRAQKFYEKYGFINSGYTHDFPIGNTPQTDLWLWKFL